MAGLASGMLSHISSVLNSCSTVFTMDLYKPFFGRDKSEQHLVRVGRFSAFVILVIATVLAIWFSHQQARRLRSDPERRRLGGGADCRGLPVGGAVEAHHGGGGDVRACCSLFPTPRSSSTILFKHVAWLMPFDNWLNRTFLVWATSMLLLVVLSLVTKPPDPEKIEGIIWSWSVAKLPESERERNRGCAESLPVVVHLHRRHGRAVRLHDVVPVLGTGEPTAVNHVPGFD